MSYEPKRPDPRAQVVEERVVCKQKSLALIVQSFLPKILLVIVTAFFVSCSEDTSPKKPFLENQNASDPSHTENKPSGPGNTTHLGSYPIIAALPEQICSTMVYRNKLGVVSNGTRLCAPPKECTLNGEKNCLAVEAFPAIDLSGILASSLAKIHENLTIFEFSGTLKNCTANGGKTCYTAPGSAAIDPLTINASKILNGYSVLGVAGTLPDCSVALTQNCLVKSGRKAAPICGDAGSNCYLPTYSNGVQSLKALNFSSLSPAVFKNGFTIGGIMGTYPSASNPLAASVDGFTDLNSASGPGGFVGQLQSSATFAWFDRNGLRYSRAGDPDLQTTSILSGTTIFGLTGAIVLPDSWDVRAGKSVGTTTGKLKMNCRNGYDLANFDIGLPKLVSSVDTAADTLNITGHGLSSGNKVQLSYSAAPSPLVAGTDYFVLRIDNDVIQLALTLGGAPINITTTGSDLTIFLWQDGSKSYFDAIDDQNNNGLSVVSLSGSAENSFCEGDIASTVDGIWKDMTIGVCDSLSDECVYQDQITGLQWSEASSVSNTASVSHWGYSIDHCESMTFNGYNDWRLPTQKEWMTAQLHNLRSVRNNFWMNNTNASINFWTATTNSWGGSLTTWTASPSNGRFSLAARETPFSVSCVRP